MAPATKGVEAIGYAARDPSGTLSPFSFTRRATGERDVQFKVLYCGICHTDLHAIRNEWGDAKYPLIPGHEIVGEVTEVGSKVRDLKPGDKVGVGCLVNSCRSCSQCEKKLENYCSKGVFTYNTLLEDGTVTYGGYSDLMVCDEGFIIRWPENYPMDKGAPMLCAGITTYSPLKLHGLDKPGLNLGVVGLGGLGHVAVKFGKAFGSKVTVISTSPSKKAEAIEKLKADDFIVSRDPSEMQKAMGTLDGIIDTVSATHDVASLLGLLKPSGKMIIVGVPDKPLEVPAFSLIAGGKTLAGSMIGGIKETQEMIDFSAAHGVLPDVEMVGMDHVNEAIERLAKGDVRYRFVIDVGNTLKKA